MRAEPRIGATMVLLALGALALLAQGCKSTNNLSQTEMQARLATYTEAARLAQIKSGSPVVADFLSNVPKSGAAGFTSSKRCVRTAAGEPVLLNGVPQFEEQCAVGLSNSMRDFGAVDKAYFVLGGWGTNPNTGDIQTNATVAGLFLYLESPGGSSGLNAEFAAVWAAAPAAEKQAAADAVAKALEARRGLIVQGITASGEVAKGVLREVYRATPVGAGLAAVEVALEAAGKTTKATVTEPFGTLPAAVLEATEPAAPAAGK